MKVRVYVSDNVAEIGVLQAFYDGCKADDKWIGSLDHYEPSDIAVVFGTYKKDVPVSYRRGHVVHEQERLGLDTIIVETGYINRGARADHHYAVGLNGLNGRADFKNKNSPDDRAGRFISNLKPWRKDGDHILMCGQVPWDASVQHINFQKWAQETAETIVGLTNRRIIYRPHPLAKTQTPWGASESKNYWLEDDLENCWCVVTFNSNSGVDAIMAGIPSVACDEGSMIMPVATGLGAINTPNKPNRIQWLSDLCYAQWTPAEMMEGKTWDHISRQT
jgi:hypothetical protein